ncbi:MAG: signal peptide peptidase SppA [Acidimicrobiia bacterium]|nr:signal peptide peptidase SppA [Acidimicrobiia bacterium]
MKKFLIGLVAGFLLAGLACLITVFAMLRFSERQPSIPGQATLILGLEGQVPEIAPVEMPFPFLRSRTPLTVYETWDLLRKAAADSRIKALVFQPRGVGAGWAKLDQIRSSLLAFKKSGKPVYAFLRNPGMREYYLATAADRIFLTREDLMDVKGLRAEVTHYRRGLDKIGVQMEVEYAGKYKDASDAFVRTSMTPETREVLNAVLDQLYTHLVEVIASSRKRTPEQVRAALDQGPFLAHEAKRLGLVDELLFENQVLDEMKKRLGQGELKKVSHRDYAKIPAISLGLEGRTRIALVTGEGPITRGDGDSLGGDEGIRSAAFSRLLREAGEDSEIKGVIVRVNSPGGDAIASDEILHEMRRLSERKPTVISMSDLAASGGYFISVSGDPILAHANTFTGSIGVVYGKLNLSNLYEKLGFNTEILKRGKNADIDTASAPLSDTGRKKLREGVDFVYRSFVDRVAEGRRKKASEIEPLAQGRLWTGAQAHRHGLVDEIGGLDEALETLRKKAMIGSEEKLRIVRYPRKRSFLELLFSESEVSLREAGLRWKMRAISEKLHLPTAGISQIPLEGMLRIAPYTLRVE